MGGGRLYAVDWFRVIADLNGKGLSLVAISEKISVPRTTVIGWKNLYAEPKHSTGERLVSLWCETMRVKRNDLPLVKINYTAAKTKRN